MRLAAIGLLFFAVNAWVSYSFYHANSYKILMVLLGVTLLFFLHEILFFKNSSSKQIWKKAAVLFIPLIVTIPGYLYYQGQYNYNFNYELAINIVLILWAIYVARSITKEKDFPALILYLGITIIYVSFLAFLEKFGLSPFSATNSYGIGQSVNRVKSTFGNTNYFAAFLIALIPIYFWICLPFGFSDNGSKTQKSNKIFLIINVSTLTIGVITLWLTQTRAALGACILSIFLQAFLLILVKGSKSKRRKLVAYFLGFCVTVIIVAAISLIIVKDTQQFKSFTESSRISQLFSKNAWYGRTMSWQAAYKSIINSPLIGYGLGSSYNLFFLFKNPDARIFWKEQSYNHVHSEVLEFTQEAGILGLIALVGFWVYLGFLLYTNYKETQNPFIKRLTIGLSGGLGAYCIQAAFSVAPRMMVTRLPVFTIFGMIIALELLRQKNKADVFTSFRTKIMSSSPLLVLLITAHIIFIPWITRQNQTNKFQSTRNSLLAVELFEQTVEKWKSPDIYGLFHLADAQNFYQRWDKLGSTLNRMHETIPHYRDVVFQKASLSLIKGNLEESKKHALEYQSFDTHHEPVIDLLSNIAFYTNDPNLFFEQFKYLLIYRLVKEKVVKPENFHQIEITKEDMNVALSFKQNDDQLEIRLADKFFNQIFTHARKLRSQPKWTMAQQNLFAQSIFSIFTNQALFRLKIKAPYKKEKDRIRKAADQLFMAEKQQQQIERMITQKHQKELKNTKYQKRKELFEKHKEERVKMTSPLSERISKLHDELAQKSNWEDFKQKRIFVISFIKKLSAIVFPPNRMEKSKPKP